MANRVSLPVPIVLLTALAIVSQNAAAQTPSTFITLYSFQGNADGAQPYGGVILGKNGALYGTTYIGGNLCSGTFGTFGCGTIFELTPAGGDSWTKTTLHNFNGGDGSQPHANLVGSNGALYGVAANGGGGLQGGAVFELTPPSTAGATWTLTVLYSFPGGLHFQGLPEGPIVIGPVGTIYGTTFGALGGTEFNPGTVFKLTPPTAPGGSWTEATLVYLDTLPGNQGSNPFSGVVSAGGLLYGTTYYSGPDVGYGTVYELTPPAAGGGAWTQTTIHNFVGSPNDGGGPEASLTVSPGGVFYGTTIEGGTGLACGGFSGPGCGTVFQLTPPATPSGEWTETVIYNFTGVNGDGSAPTASVTFGTNRKLYGTTSQGGSSGDGIVFELTPPAMPGGVWTETVLHSFTGLNGDGAVPLAGLARGPSGAFYGTTQLGGTTGEGTVFAIRP